MSLTRSPKNWSLPSTFFGVRHRNSAARSSDLYTLGDAIAYQLLKFDGLPGTMERAWRDASLADSVRVRQTAG